MTEYELRVTLEDVLSLQVATPSVLRSAAA